MQNAIIIVLIILVFLIPIAAFIIYRRIKARKLKAQLKNGEIFDKECENIGVVKCGKDYPIILPRLAINQNGFFNGDQYEFLFLYEDPSKRKLKAILNISDIAMDVSQFPNNQLLDESNNANVLEPIPEEEEKL